MSDDVTCPHLLVIKWNYIQTAAYDFLLFVTLYFQKFILFEKKGSKILPIFVLSQFFQVAPSALLLSGLFSVRYHSRFHYLD